MWHRKVVFMNITAHYKNRTCNTDNCLNLDSLDSIDLHDCKPIFYVLVNILLLL